MQFNVIWVLLTATLTYLLTADIARAGITGFVFILIWIVIQFIKDMIYLLRTKQPLGEPSIKNKQVTERIIIYSLLAISLLFAALHYFSHYAIYKEVKNMVAVYNTMPASYLKEATNRLKTNPNNMHYCSLLMMPSLENNDPEALATYLAYYQNEEKYCEKWWVWGQSNCGYLKNIASHHNSPELAKNIKLCEIAKKLTQ